MIYKDIDLVKLHLKQTPPKTGPNASSRLQQMLADERLVTSYQLYWLGAILDELKEPEANPSIPYRRIVLRMIAKCWYSIEKFRLNLGRTDKLAEAVKKLSNHVKLEATYKEADTLEALEGLPLSVTNKFVDYFTRYVPSRLIAVFYQAEVSDLKDYLRDKELARISCDRDDAIYQNHIKERKIVINSKWYEYIKENMAIICGWHRERLISFLQRRNPSVPAIPMKIEAPQKRNLNDANRYWSLLHRAAITKGAPLTDIYTAAPVEKPFTIDHFIPWTFVLHDQLWNLAPTSKSMNSAKSNRLPALQKYLVPFCKQQFDALQLALKTKTIPKKTIEEYYTVFTPEELRNMPLEPFTDKLSAAIQPLHQIAQNMGFQIWQD